MVKFVKFSIIILFSFGLFHTISAEVIDHANVFSQGAVQSVNSSLDKLEKKTGKELVIETVPQVEKGSTSNFALERARELNVNGVYTLISMKEKKIEIKIGNKTRDYFTKNNSAEFKNLIIAGFKSKDFDKGLLDASQYYIQTTESFASVGSGRNSVDSTYGSTSQFPWMTILLIGLGIFLILRIIKMMRSRNNPNDVTNPNYGNPGYGGSGIFGSILGGVFGAVVGNWLYDKFTGNDGLFASDHSPHSDGFLNEDNGSDFYSDSGSFDGGGDFGGDSGGDW